MSALNILDKYYKKYNNNQYYISIFEYNGKINLVCEDFMEKKDFYRMHAEFCKTISNPKRQEILDALRIKEMTVNELIDITGISQSNLSQHLSLLRSKGIVRALRNGTSISYSIVNKKIIKAYDLVSEVLLESLASQNRTVNEALNKKS